MLSLRVTSPTDDPYLVGASRCSEDGAPSCPPITRTRPCPFRTFGVIAPVPPQDGLATFPASRVPPNGSVNTLVIPPRMQNVALNGAYSRVEKTLPAPYTTSWPVVSAAADETGSINTTASTAPNFGLEI